VGANESLVFFEYMNRSWFDIVAN